MKKDNPNRRIKIIIIVGPTASGKSDLGIKIAKKYGGEIISADSRQVYRGMDIGTGKVTKKEQRSVKHHLIDIESPKKQFTASDFKKLGDVALSDLANRTKLPIVVGGTGFYIDILLGRMQAAEVKPDKRLRAELEKQSTEQLFNRLSFLDPRRSRTIDRHNRRRLIRALEIIITTGEPVPRMDHESRIMNYDILWIGLAPKDLKEIIKKRLDKRLRQDMIKEVLRLHKEGVSWKRLDDYGLEYRWVSRWLKNKSAIHNSRFNSSEEYKNLLRDIVNYSKRQMTWFKKNKDINWINNWQDTNKKITAFLSR